MVFNSLAYLVFFPIVIAIYFLTPVRFRWFVVLVGSYFFYMSWKPVYGLLLFATTLVDWSLALWMAKYADLSRRRRILIVSIVMNLAVLFFFKYFNFISISFWSIFGFSGAPLIVRIALPIGISFYTFQSLAYMIDVYRGDLKPERNFGRYAAFVSFFPHLVSGPILRPSNIIPQMHEEKKWDAENVRLGLFLIAAGLIKKVVIADRISFLVERVYNAPGSLSGMTLLIATWLFAFQIYCDFAGYTDIAIGSARILGYRIPDNFHAPYFSQTISEFWRRWHISLSSWLRDYLYIPLGGSRNGDFNTYRNLMITMILGGLWHGAAWTFVLWGCLHGALLVLSRLTLAVRNRFWARIAAPALLVSAWRILVTFNVVTLTWVFFRAKSIHDALLIIRAIFLHFGSLQLFVFPRGELAFAFYAISALLLFDIVESRKFFSKHIPQLSWGYQVGFVWLVIFMLISFGIRNGPEFLYFQF